MEEVDLTAFEYALSKIEDGFIFERSALSFLSAIMGYDFIPSGRVRDRGIDGLQNIFERRGFETQIYQLSTERDAEAKLSASLSKLRDNRLKF